MHNIEVTVSGPANSGKSTIAYQIADALKGLGFDVEVEDQFLRGPWYLEQAERVKALSDRGTRVNIVTERD